MPDSLAGQARRLYDERHRRAAYIPAVLLGDSAWDMLLCLFVQMESGRSSTASMVSVAAGVSAPIAARWMKALCQEGLVLDTGETVILSAAGHEAIRRYLEEVPPHP